MANDASTIAYVAARIASLFDTEDPETSVTELDTSDGSHCLDITIDGETVRVTIS